MLAPKRAANPQPIATPRVERIDRPIQAAAPEHAPAATLAAAPVRTARPKPATPGAPPQTDSYLALDDDPIDVGIVMRVALDSAAAVQADVIFDAEGRARAIRPVK
jgi:hypothetical protein